MRSHALSLLAGLALLLAGCATGKVIEVAPSDTSVSPDAGIHRIFLVGDAGEINAIQEKNLSLLRSRIQSSDIPATVLYLGDNIYPEGVPLKEDSVYYAESVRILEAQMQATEGIAEQTIFVPGNHDWKQGRPGGYQAIRTQEKIIKDAGIAKTRLLPKKGCPGPEVIEVTDDLVVFIIDSQWWLHDWNTEKDINEDCEILTRGEFLIAFRETLKEYQEQQVIVAMHHPLVSAGSHGGYFTFRDHLFPLSNIHGLEWLYLPLPVLGSIYPVYRGNFGNVQDIPNHKYQELKKGLIAAAKLYDNVVFVSGHEHALEYHVNNEMHFIVSGGGSRFSHIGKPASMKFGHGAPGFVQLNISDGGGIDMLVWEPDHERGASPVYRTRVTEGKARNVETIDYPDVSTLPKTMTLPLSTEYAKGGLHRFLFGERYRDVYEIPVEVPVVDLSKMYGGLEPVKKGGGMQTNSLRLVAKDGKEYSARAMYKDASKLLPENLQNTFASDILQDQFTASHPYAAFVIPEIADEAGVYHTNPQLVYIPKQDALGVYAEEFGDQLFLLEERPSGDWSDAKSFGNSEDIVSFTDVLEETMDDYRNQVDQEAVARARMFDHFLGDWDRHDDQWRWAAFPRQDGDGKYYQPIPRDRDQAFAIYDGLIVGLAKWFTPTVRKLSVFQEDIENGKWFNDNGKWFDRDFTNELTKEQWITQATQLQAALTDEVIETNIRQLPPAVFAKGGERIIEILKAHRARLPEFASWYYRELAKKVHVRGTNNADYFEITRAKGSTTVRVFDSNKEGEKNEQFYERTFSDDETKELQIYALEGQDKVVINGDAAGGIQVYIIGGDGDDMVSVENGKHAGSIRFQDTQDASKSTDGNVAYKRVGDAQNRFERRTFLYDYTVPKILIAGNPDDGFLIGGGAQWVKHGFQKNPYSSIHSLTGFYAFATQAFGFDYSGEWIDAVGKLNVGVNAGYKGPTFVQNYFGFGNESVEIEDTEDTDFYRVRKSNISIIPYLRAGKEQGLSLFLRGGYEQHEVEDSENRFVTFPNNGLPLDVFEKKQFGAVAAAFQYKVVDDPLLTRRGIDLDISAGLDIPLNGDDDAHQYFKTALALYYQFKTLGRPVLATRVGMDWHGGDFQFYQGAILGSQGNFRGVRKERFVGDKMFYHNTDLRFRISQWKSYYFPAAFGIQFNFDHGRVWLEGEDSDTWHYAYGGGFWLSPFQTFLLSLNYHKSDIDQRFSVGMGFLF